MGGPDKSCVLRAVADAVTGTFSRVPCCHSMTDDNDTRIGLLSGLFAVIMVIALSVMAMSALATTSNASASREVLGGEMPNAARIVLWP